MNRKVPHFTLLTNSALLLLLTFAVAACATGRSDFEEGHEWIMPRPAAEIRLSVTDADGAPIPNAILWAYLGNERYVTDGSFVNYDPLTGRASDESGEIVAHYLGEEGGGYEVPMNAPSPPQHRLVVEAPGYTTASVNLDDLLFVQTHRTGKTSLTVGDATVEMVVVAYRVILEKE